MEAQEKSATQKDQKPLQLKRLAVAAGILLAVFLLGYIPSCVSARSAKEQNAQLEHKLRLAELRGHLGMASYEANRNNYANAAQRSTEFFNGLGKLINSTGDETLKRKLEELLSRRDEVTSNLAEANPAVKEKMAQMYADFFQITATQMDRNP